MTAQTNKQIMDVKTELENKISNFKESNFKYWIGIIFSIFTAFLGFYFMALNDIEKKVKSDVSIKINKISNQVFSLEKKMQSQSHIGKSNKQLINNIDKKIQNQVDSMIKKPL